MSTSVNEDHDRERGDVVLVVGCEDIQIEAVLGVGLRARPGRQIAVLRACGRLCVRIKDSRPRGGRDWVSEPKCAGWRRSVGNA